VPMGALEATSFRATWTAPASFSRWIESRKRMITGCGLIPPDLARYVIFKGSLCIEGISLTVAKVEGAKVTVAIIPHTVTMTNLKSLRPGDPVNLEVDMVAKYVEKMIKGESANSGLTVERLVGEGF